MSLITVESGDGVVSICMNRPEKLNALSVEMLRSLCDAFQAASRGESCGAIHFSGAGRTFCAGADRSAVAQLRGADEIRAYAELMLETMTAIHACSVPVVASVQGHALGAGCGLVALCDFAVSAKDANFGYPEITHGILPALVVPGLVARVGESRAFELLATGRNFDAEEALALGIVSSVAEGDPSREAMKIALRPGGRARYTDPGVAKSRRPSRRGMSSTRRWTSLRSKTSNRELQLPRDTAAANRLYHFFMINSG